MSDLGAAFYRVVLRRLSRWMLNPSLDWPQQRARMESMALRSKPAAGVEVSTGQLGGVPGERLQPVGAAAGLVLLYLHGGGFTVGSAVTHRAFVSRLVSRLGVTGWVIDYRLAPEHPFPAAGDDVLTAYRALVADGTKVLVAGDSCGGSLALSLALQVRDLGLPAPVVLGLISPDLDGTDEALSRLHDSRREPNVTAASSRQYYANYAGDHDRSDPLLSPLLADLQGLPALVVDSAADDPMADHAARLAEKAVAAGVPVDHVEHPDRWHAFHLLAGQWRPATEALEGFADRLLAATGSGTG